MSDFHDADRNMLIETNTLLKTHVKTATKIMEDHEGRIRKVENKQNKILGIFTLFSAGAGSVAATAWNKFF